VERGAVKRLWEAASRLVRADGPECGRVEAGVDPVGDVDVGNLVGQGLLLEGPIKGNGTVDAGFATLGSGEAGQPVGRVLGAYLRHAHRWV